MAKNILIINSYASCPTYGGGMYRHYYLAREFERLGHKTTIISASFSHLFKHFPQMNDKTFKSEVVDEVDFIWVKTMKYRHSFDKKRVATWFEFMAKLFFVGKYIQNKPDVIICSPTEVLSIIPAYFLAKKYKAKLVFEVRDIWPLSLIEIGGFSKYNPFVVFMSFVEKFALNNADIVVSNLSNYSDHIKELNIDKTAHWISNGINLDEMQSQDDLPVEVRNLIPTDKFIVGYTGKLGKSNAMSYFVEAAKLLDANENIKFVIVGDGAEKSSLLDLAKGLNNVIFIDPIPKSQIQNMLSLFDVCYIGWLDKEIYKFGISPNKLYDYMYSAKPVLQAISIENSLVSTASFGICVKAQDVNSIVKAINTLYDMPKEDLENMGKNGKKFILENFTYKKLSQKYIDIL